MQDQGRFITFEGTDGSGKTTQMRLLADRLRREGRNVLETVEPGGTAIGKQVRRILLDAANHDLRPTAELLLYFASRAQNVDECILPALSAGNIVLCDRFTDSTLAYQGYARGLGEETVRALDKIACRDLVPDLTLLIDVDLDTGLARAHTRNAAGSAAETRMDDQSLAFHRKVRDAYMALAKQHAGRFRIIDGRGAPEAVAAKVWESVAGYV
ncbi:MAG: thymidylate kinase [Bryobacterales bacterium]|nr:thymidylate kinase [Bryobacterales bacterium]